MKLPTTARAALAAILACLVTGCTAADGYEFVRHAGAAKAECDRERTVAAQQACEAEYRQSFEAYRDERRAVIEDERDPAPR